MSGFNFLLEHVLDGGGTVAQRIDAQGKTFASALLNIEVPIPTDILQLSLAEREDPPDD